MEDLEEKIKTNKEVLFDKEYVKIKKDTFNSIDKVVKESKKVMEMQPKIQTVFEEVDNYTKSYKTLEKENKNIQREVKALRTRNHNLQEENRYIKDLLKAIYEAIKRFFRELLEIGNEKVKQRTTDEIKEYYDNRDFNKDDIIEIAEDTTKEDDLFEYANIHRYEKNHYHKDKDSFEISM